ncbi:MAG TPA: hypothetical protein VGN37_02700 [Actinocatenispora sp.]
MPDDTRTALLARRYRRWLLAYPRGYRRERGPEIIGTLLDATDPGRSRPPAREVVHLLGHGVGRRAVEAGRRAFVVAAFAAVLGGLSGIALGSWLSWRTVDTMAPDSATAGRVARQILPGPTDSGGHFGRHTFWNPYSEHTLHGGTGVRAGSAEGGGTVPHGARYDETARAVAARMRAHGWHDVHTTIEALDPNTSPPGIAYVTGTRDGYLAAVEVDAADGDNPATVGLDLMWAEPASQPAATTAGGVVGILIGVLFGLLTSKRMRRHGRGMQRTYSGLCLATLLLLTPACFANIPTATGSLMANTYRNHPGPSVYWGGFVIYGAEPLAILSLVPILAVVVLCLWPRPQPSRTLTTAT